MIIRNHTTKETATRSSLNNRGYERIEHPLFVPIRGYCAPPVIERRRSQRLGGTIADNHLKKLFIVIALLMCRWAGAWADEISESQAMKLAQQFVAGSQTRKSVPAVKAAGQVNGLYVFNVGGSGFVVVSNDDQTVPILAYGQDGNIDTDDMPDEMRAWLQGYATQIAWLRTHDAQDTRKKVQRRLDGETKADIAPMITTNWNQGQPYNDQCPTIDNVRTVTGCVATAMAQLMYFYQWPKTSAAIPAYTTKTKDSEGAAYELTVDALPSTTFDWDDMLANYTPLNPETGIRYLSGTTTQQQAVATLMKYCGAALQMSYGLSANGGSAAYNEDIPYALKSCFGYDGGVRHCYRKNYSMAEWVDIIYGELAASRPVALGGQSAGGGHSFVCDGYRSVDDADYFHINWGWAGSSDGYFLLSVLNPYEQGIGGSSTLDGFSFGQDAVVGIQPPVDGNADYCLSLEKLNLSKPDATVTSKTYTRDNADNPFTGISIDYDVWNYNRIAAAYDVAVQLVDAGGAVVQTFGGSENLTLAWNEHVAATISDCNIPASVKDGTYFIKVMSRPNGTSSWQECFDGDAYRLTAVVSGNELTISVPITANVTPESVSFNVEGASETGAEQTVTATVTGGAGNFAGNLVLRVNGTAVMGQVAQVAAGQSVQLTYSYLPTVVGDNELTLWTHRSRGTQVSGSVTKNISTLVMADYAANTKTIKANDGKTGNVRLEGRTLYKDGEWNTICLPFDLSLDGSVLAGAEARTLSSADITDGVLNLTFGEPVTTLTAGTPYIIKWARAADYGSAEPATRDIVSPVFEGVTIQNTFNDFISEDRKVEFKGRYSAYTYTEETRSTLFLGSGNKLYFPQPSTDVQTDDTVLPTVGAFRAYFNINAEAASSIKAFNIDFGDGEATSVTTPLALGRGAGGEAWYTLDGRRLNARSAEGRLQGKKPTAKGIYILNGRKVVLQ